MPRPQVRSRIRRSWMLMGCASWHVLGCAPVPFPPWMIDRPTVLALTQEVVTQGPWGDRAEADAPRTLHDALPGDRVRFTAPVVDAAGPLDPVVVDMIGFLCDSPRCVVDSDLSVARPCPSLSPNGIGEPCMLGRASPLELTVGTPVSTPYLYSPSSLVFIGSASAGVDARGCVERLAARDLLGDCFLLNRPLHVGPLGPLLDAARDAGIDVSFSSEVRDLHRNRNPTVEKFELLDETGMARMVRSGQTVTAPAGQEILVRYIPDPELDLEAQWFATEDEYMVYTVTETLRGRWYGTHRDLEIETPSDLQTLLHVPQDAPFLLYFVAIDENGGEQWGWLTVQPSN